MTVTLHGSRRDGSGSSTVLTGWRAGLKLLPPDGHALRPELKEPGVVPQWCRTWPDPPLSPSAAFRTSVGFYWHPWRVQLFNLCRVDCKNPPGAASKTRTCPRLDALKPVSNCPA
ncbi:hypothetical protein D4764_15G0004690 [Takifugu flavidus]|uniref:Uncharacterized protein n=1 Tax=Takifugu flavidus TaxID=433684 RepID=A0A5C6P192_9TELE|nr:hypothetical protein D4764_15G0004690 [Takifugu flavidus]